MEWILTINSRGKIAVYCSDVAGAFDRVKTRRLVDKMRLKGVHPQLVRLIESWLRQRRANVIVGGEASIEFILRNMIYQGTVLGPILWNVFFEEARVISVIKLESLFDNCHQFFLIWHFLIC